MGLPGRVPSLRFPPDLQIPSECIGPIVPPKPASPPTALPATVASTPYPIARWDEEAFAAFAEGRDPAPCPACGRVGFYGPRATDEAHRFRECRFCGFHQVVGKRASRALPTVHGCPGWPEVARAPYIWWVPADVEAYECVFCKRTVPVSEHLVTAPSEDPQHPWWRVPQGKSRFYYARFWENWPFTKGRVFL